MNNSLSVSSRTGNVGASFPSDVRHQWFKQNIKECPSAQIAQEKDVEFILHREHDNHKQPWASYNKKNSAAKSEATKVGYMQILQVPAHEKDTFNTVVKRLSAVAQSLGQNYVVNNTYLVAIMYYVMNSCKKS